MHKHVILFIALANLGYSAEEVRCPEVLSGDAMICEFFKGDLKIVHIAGVDAPEKGQYGYEESMATLSKLTNRKVVTLVIVKREESHVVARVFTHTDLGSELLKSCWSYYRAEAGLNSVQNSGYKLYEDKCRWNKKGVFKNGPNYYSRAENYRKANIDELKQKYFSGTKDPKANDLNRPHVPKEKN
jgi:endonuclease YncB( thermonuclease family)